MTSKEIIQKRILNSNLPDKVKNSILPRIRVLRDKGCWTVNDDWSVYTGGRLHRKLYEAFIGPIVNGNFVCHKCDRRGCINPDHLFQGTQSDNMQDARRKGRVTSLTFPDKVKDKEMEELREKDRWRQLVRFVGE